MRIFAIGLLLVSGCVSERMDQPDEPKLLLTPDRVWIQGEPSRVMARWTYACEGTGDWGCPRSTVTVLGVTGSGFRVFEDPTGISAPGYVTFYATATTDGPITLAARLRFDPTGQIATATASTVGDHETGIAAASVEIPAIQ